jgi:hypothetical protein
LFEIKGYAHFVPNSDHLPAQGFNANDFRQLTVEDRGPMDWGGTHGTFKCFFAVAKPYPSRNTAMFVFSVKVPTVSYSYVTGSIRFLN